MKRRAASLLLAVVMVLCLLPATAFAAAGKAIASGVCGASGDTVRWELSESGTLTISGKGAMEDYYSQRTSWDKYKDKITAVVVEKGVTKIGSSAFKDCQALVSASIASGVKEIGDKAFSGCVSLEKVNIPKGVKSIGVELFFQCASLENVTLPEGVNDIWESAFRLCVSLKKINIPASVQHIGPFVFENCLSMEKITVASGNKNYASRDGVLYSADPSTKKLTTLLRCPGGKSGSVTVAKGVTGIDQAAFENCLGVTAVTLPEGLEGIFDNAFLSCMGLEKMTIPASVKIIGENAFLGCIGLEKFTVAAKNQTFTTVDGVLYSKDRSELLQCPGGKMGDVTIPAETSSMYENALALCLGVENIRVASGNRYFAALDGVLYSRYLTELLQCPGGKEGAVTIPAETTGIRTGAFQGCMGVTGYQVEKGSKSFAAQDGVLYNKKMTTLVQCPMWTEGDFAIPKSVSTIGDGAFTNCMLLTSVMVPTSVKKVGAQAFAGCLSLTDVYYAGTEKQWNAIWVQEGNDIFSQAEIHYNYKWTLRPVTAKAEYIASTGKPYIKWEAVTGAVKYEVYRSGSKNGTYKLLGTTEKLNYTDKTASAGYTYFYKVKAVNAAGSKSDYSAVVAGVCRCPKPVAVPDYLSSTGKPYIKWKAVTGAAKYEVYRAASKDGKYTKVAVTTKLNYTDKDAAVGQSYYYKIKAVSKVRTAANSVFSAAVKATCHCAKPTVKITTTSSGAPKLTWNAVDGAAKYEVYRATSKAGKYTRYDTTTKTSYTNTSAKAGTTYYYKIKAVSKKTTSANSSYSAVVSVRAK